MNEVVLFCCSNFTLPLFLVVAISWGLNAQTLYLFLLMSDNFEQCCSHLNSCYPLNLLQTWVYNYHTKTYKDFLDVTENKTSWILQDMLEITEKNILGRLNMLLVTKDLKKIFIFTCIFFQNKNCLHFLYHFFYMIAQLLWNIFLKENLTYAQNFKYDFFFGRTCFITIGVSHKKKFMEKILLLKKINL